MESPYVAKADGGIVLMTHRQMLIFLLSNEKGGEEAGWLRLKKEGRINLPSMMRKEMGSERGSHAH